MKKYEPTQPIEQLLRGRIHQSLAKEFFRKHGRDALSLVDLYNGLGFTLEQVREAEAIRLRHLEVPPGQLEEVLDSSMQYWSKRFY